MNHAVIQTGGKQYFVTEGERVRVDRLVAEEGKKVSFAEVLLTFDGKKTSVGAPLVAGAKVEGTILKQARTPKVMGVKMGAKKRRKKYFTHRQHYTEVTITKITAK